MKIKLIQISAILICCSEFGRSLFVPEQLTTLLSFIYTNIPPVRKGTDSRVGLGFRLGPNADFQVLFELGPQQNTVPIGPNGGSNPSTSKRETYPQQTPMKNPTWLQLWKQQTGNNAGHEGNFHSGADDSNSIPVLDEDVVNHLKQLYKEQPNASNESSRVVDVKNSTISQQP